jgi:hypothetical protein
VEAADWYEITVSALFPQIQHADDSPWEHLHLHGGLETGQDDNDFEQITVLGSTSTMLLKLWKRTAISITIIEVGFRGETRFLFICIFVLPSSSQHGEAPIWCPWGVTIESPGLARRPS